MPDRLRTRLTIAGNFSPIYSGYIREPNVYLVRGLGGLKAGNSGIYLKNLGTTSNIICTTDALTLTGGQASIGLGDITGITDALTLAVGSANIDIGQYEAANTWFNDSWWPAPFWESAWWPETTAPTVDTGIADFTAAENTVYILTVSFETNGEAIQSVTNTGDTPPAGWFGPIYSGVSGTVFSYSYYFSLNDGAAGTGPYNVETTIVTDGGTVSDSFTLTVVADIETVTDALTLTAGQAGIYNGTQTTTDTLILLSRRASINGGGGPSRAVRSFDSWRGHRP